MRGLAIEHDGKRFSIHMPVKNGCERVQVRLFSDANKSIFEYSDVSPFAPQSHRSQTGEVFDADWGKQEERNRQADQELRFPVVDIALNEGMEGVIEIDVHEPGAYCFNGNFWPEAHGIAQEIRIPHDHLEHWDNALHLNPKSNRIQRFHLAATVELNHSVLDYSFDALRNDWSGSIGVFDPATGDCLAEEAVSAVVDLPAISTGQGVSRQRMIAALSWATRYLVGCTNTKADSPTFGGQFLLYDLAARTRLRSDWPWSWGPLASMLLRAADIRELDAGMSSEQLCAAGLSIGEASLRQQILDVAHPAYGLVRTTIEPGPTREHGFKNRASAADTLFLVGWGWMPLYRATKDQRFLQAAGKVVLAVGRLLDQSQGGVIPQAYDLKRNSWDRNMFFESSMGMKGLAELCRETGDNHHRTVMLRYVDKLLAAFEREDGLWDAMLYSESGKVSSCNYFVKSFGYCVDGLLAVHAAAPDQGHLERAVKITHHVLKAQQEDGSWSVRLDRPPEEVGITDKGTALWAYLFIRLYKATGDETYLAAGSKALEWCMDHQYFGNDPIARGGIVGRSWPSGIIYRHWFDMITTYTVAFFGAALTEALGLDEYSAGPS